MDLYASEDLRVTFRDLPHAPRSVCVVTFDSFNDLGTLERSGFGEGFFLSREIPAVHVISRLNNWYQEPDLPNALAAIRRVSEQFDRVVTYGSSMGGFAALRYGASVNGSTAIAISPQFSIDPAEVSFENRWAKYAETISFRHRVADFPKIRQAYVFYDPYDRDRRHLDLIAAHYSTTGIRIPYAGHPVGSYLGETSLLTGAIEAICAERFDAPAFEQEARRLRRRSGQYLFSLARRLPLRRLETKLALARLAVEANPTEPTYGSYLAVVMDRMGMWEESERRHLAAVALQPGQPHIVEAYVRFLMRQGRFDEASELADRAYAIAPAVGYVARAWFLCLAAAGRWSEAVQVARGMLESDRVLVLIALREFREIAVRRAFGRRSGRRDGRHRPPFNLSVAGEIQVGRPRTWSGKLTDVLVGTSARPTDG